MVTVFCLDLLFQSTLPRGSDRNRGLRAKETVISIHAPSRERRHQARPRGRRNYFNPRSLAGATHQTLAVAPVIAISIHAPSRERQLLPAVTPTYLVFQSTLPRGSDKTALAIIEGVVEFQSTLPRGSDDRHRRVSFHDREFQSTLPRGSDRVKPALTLAALKISIHAPSRERPSSIASLSCSTDFNPRSLAGATSLGATNTEGPANFNPRSLAGATLQIRE